MTGYDEFDAFLVESHVGNGKDFTLREWERMSPFARTKWIRRWEDAFHSDNHSVFEQMAAEQRRWSVG